MIFIQFIIACLLFSMSAFSKEIRYEESSISISHSGYTQDSILVHQDNIRSRVYEVVTEPGRLVYEDQYENSCDLIEANGKGDWKDFYSTSKDKKADALADAILGVGQNWAPQLVSYFHKKPRTWQEFTGVIKKAEEENESLRGVYARVIKQYGSRNKSNLGYDVTSVDCKQIHVGTTSYYEEGTTKSEVIDILDLSLKVNTKGLLLLNDEDFRYRLYFTGLNHLGQARFQVGNLSNNHKLKSIEWRGQIPNIEIDVEFERSLSVPRNDLDVQFKYDGRNLNLSIFNQGKEMAKDIAGRAFVEIEIVEDGWFVFNDNIETVMIEIDPTQKQIQKSVQIPNLKGKEIFLKYRIKYNDNILYRDNTFSSTKQTKTKDL